MENQLRRWLAEGNLSDDGRTNEIYEIVIDNPSKFDDLVALLDDKDPVVRGHGADVLEKIAREKPELFLPYMHVFLTTGLEDPLPMVKWHLAMIFGHLAIFPELNDLTVPALMKLLEDETALTQNWAITSLCIIGQLYFDYQTTIVGQLAKFKNTPKPSLRKRVEKALGVLLEDAPFPQGWVKSDLIQVKLDLE